jgi:hypothetical protein
MLAKEESGNEKEFSFGCFVEIIYLFEAHQDLGNHLRYKNSLFYVFL